jgi:asparagine synthase (glutamine-hydrolysing)
MFALGLWEPNNRRLTLIRDRLGIKPLYYYYDGKTFLFASEVRALLKTGLVPRNISRAALEGYLTYGSVQQPLTIVENVYAVLPGHFLVFERGEIRTEPYWSLQAEPKSLPKKDERETIAEIGSLLEESVRLRMIADVPVGAFLSGGIDSSAIVALMRRATNGTIKTFSVYFNEKEFSEFPYAEHIASKFGTEHHPLLITEDDLLKKLPTILDAMDQPSIDGVNSYVVSEATAQAGLKVALSGLGGDEVFVGYSYFRTITRDERLREAIQQVPQSVRRIAARAINSVTNSNRATKLTGLLAGNELHTHSLFLHRQLFNGAQRDALLSHNGYRLEQYERDLFLYSEWEKRRYATCNNSDPVNQASCYDLSGYLSNTLLRDSDVMSMVHGLEVRVPLIDHRVVERLLSIPGGEKIRPTTPKWVLVDAVGELPEKIVHRPKRGFEFPFKKWLLGSLEDEARASLSNTKLQSVLQIDAPKLFWLDFEAGRISWTRVWSLVVLSKYLARIDA